MKEIPGYECLYQITTSGKVFSMTRERFISQWKNNQGYMFVSLYNGGKRKNRSVHSLLLETYEGYAPTKHHQASHKNGIRTDNRIENLRWLTVSENHNDKKNHGTFQCGTKHGNSKLTESQVIELRNSKESHAYWARKLGLSEYAIAYARRIGWKHVA